MENTETKKQEDLVENDTKEVEQENKEESLNKKIALIIIAFFIISMALVVIAIFVYLAKDFDEELEVYKKYKKIGNITLGEDNVVYKVQDKETNLNYILKEIKYENDSIKDTIINDVKFMMHLNKNNNSILFYEYFVEDKTVFIITEEYIGDLSLYISDAFNYIKNILSQLNNILEHLHQNKMVHNNIKLENILVIEKNDNDGYKIKLGNYNKAKLFSDKEIELNEDLEIKPYDGDDDKEYYKIKDLEDIGKEIYRMKFQEIDESNEEMIKKINMTEEIEDNLKDLMINLISKNLTNWDDYFHHKYFQN